MASKIYWNFLSRLLLLVLAVISDGSAINIDCGGKAFHCLNSTNFMICVDNGNGIATTVENMNLPCPPGTECHPDNMYECEFPRQTTPSINSLVTNKTSDNVNIELVATTTLPDDVLVTGIGDTSNGKTLDQYFATQIITGGTETAVVHQETIKPSQEINTTGNEPNIDITTQMYLVDIPNATDSITESPFATVDVTMNTLADATVTIAEASIGVSSINYSISDFMLTTESEINLTSQLQNITNEEKSAKYPNEIIDTNYITSLPHTISTDIFLENINMESTGNLEVTERPNISISMDNTNQTNEISRLTDPENFNAGSTVSFLDSKVSVIDFYNSTSTDITVQADNISKNNTFENDNSEITVNLSLSTNQIVTESSYISITTDNTIQTNDTFNVTEPEIFNAGSTASPFFDSKLTVVDSYNSTSSDITVQADKISTDRAFENTKTETTVNLSLSTNLAVTENPYISITTNHITQVNETLNLTEPESFNTESTPSTFLDSKVTVVDSYNSISTDITVQADKISTDSAFENTNAETTVNSFLSTNLVVTENPNISITTDNTTQINDTLKLTEAESFNAGSTVSTFLNSKVTVVDSYNSTSSDITVQADKISTDRAFENTKAETTVNLSLSTNLAVTENPYISITTNHITQVNETLKLTEPESFNTESTSSTFLDSKVTVVDSNNSISTDITVQADKISTDSAFENTNAKTTVNSFLSTNLVVTENPNISITTDHITQVNETLKLTEPESFNTESTPSTFLDSKVTVVDFYNSISTDITVQADKISTDSAFENTNAETTVNSFFSTNLVVTENPNISITTDNTTQINDTLKLTEAESFNAGSTVSTFLDSKVTVVNSYNSTSSDITVQADKISTDRAFENIYAETTVNLSVATNLVVTENPNISTTTNNTTQMNETLTVTESDTFNTGSTVSTFLESTVSVVDSYNSTTSDVTIQTDKISTASDMTAQTNKVTADITLEYANQVTLETPVSTEISVTEHASKPMSQDITSQTNQVWTEKASTILPLSPTVMTTERLHISSTPKITLQTDKFVGLVNTETTVDHAYISTSQDITSQKGNPSIVTMTEDTSILPDIAVQTDNILTEDSYGKDNTEITIISSQLTTKVPMTKQYLNINRTDLEQTRLDNVNAETTTHQLLFTDTNFNTGFENNGTEISHLSVHTTVTANSDLNDSTIQTNKTITDCVFENVNVETTVNLSLPPKITPIESSFKANITNLSVKTDSILDVNSETTVNPSGKPIVTDAEIFYEFEISTGSTTHTDHILTNSIVENVIADVNTDDASYAYIAATNSASQNIIVGITESSLLPVNTEMTENTQSFVADSTNWTNEMTDIVIENVNMGSTINHPLPSVATTAINQIYDSTTISNAIQKDNIMTNALFETTNSDRNISEHLASVEKPATAEQYEMINSTKQPLNEAASDSSLKVSITETVLVTEYPGLFANIVSENVNIDSKINNLFSPTTVLIEYPPKLENITNIVQLATSLAEDRHTTSHHDIKVTPEATDKNKNLMGDVAVVDVNVTNNSVNTENNNNNLLISNNLWDLLNDHRKTESTLITTIEVINRNEADNAIPLPIDVDMNMINQNIVNENKISLSLSHTDFILDDKTELIISTNDKVTNSVAMPTEIINSKDKIKDQISNSEVDKNSKNLLSNTLFSTSDKSATKVIFTNTDGYGSTVTNLDKPSSTNKQFIEIDAALKNTEKEIVNPSIPITTSSTQSSSDKTLKINKLIPNYPSVRYTLNYDYTTEIPTNKLASNSDSDTKTTVSYLSQMNNIQESTLNTFNTKATTIVAENSKQTVHISGITNSSKSTPKPQSVSDHNSNSHSKPQISNDAQNFSCRHRSRGRYSDIVDCRKFYICIGRHDPIVGHCPLNTVFSDGRKQCTKILSDCVRHNDFECTSEGRFKDYVRNNVYYVCVKRNEGNHFVRFKFQCQNDYYLDTVHIKCIHIEAPKDSQSTSIDESSKSDTSGNENKNKKKHRNEREESEEKKDTKESNDRSSSIFVCTEKGKFADPRDCRKYYECKDKNESGFRRKRRKCDKDEVFHKERKRCVDVDSYKCN